MEIGGVSGSANAQTQIYELTLISWFLQRRSSQLQTFQISCISSRKRSEVIETCKKWSNLLKLIQFELAKQCQNKYRLNEAATRVPKKFVFEAFLKPDFVHREWFIFL